MRNQGWWQFLEQRSNVGKEGSGGGRRGRGGVGEGEKADILNKRVIVIIGNIGNVDPRLKVGRHHGGGSGLARNVYRTREDLKDTLKCISKEINFNLYEENKLKKSKKLKSKFPR